MSASEGKIRVLLVDDSVVVRRLLSEAIASDPGMEVAGYAANGRIALGLVNQVVPDIVTLDVEMPVMNGLATLQAMRQAGHRFPIIMFSTLTERGAEATIDALALGASDYVAKPAGIGNYNAARDRIQEALLPKIKALCHKPSAVSGRTPAISIHAKPALPRRMSEPVAVVAIGCSTGGPNALAEILPNFPHDFPVPILIVQHMPPTFTRFLAQRLTGLCQLPVEEAEEGTPLRAGKIVVAPGGYHLVAEGRGALTTMHVTQEAPENSCRPSVDVLFRSVARAFPNQVLAAVLTGMGQDGLRGCEQLAREGGEIVAQDEATSVVWGMPGFVARANLADAVLPLLDIGAHIVRRVMARRLTQTSISRVAVPR
jgi:two-component system, chemotaxis family, protein-glutamate methylesterase/glutaminase